MLGAGAYPVFALHARARAQTSSPNNPGEVGETPPSAPRRPRAQRTDLLPAAPRRREAAQAAREERIRKRDGRKRRDVGEKGKREQEEGRDEEPKCTEARGGGEGPGAGEVWAGVQHRQVEAAEVRGRRVQPLRCRKVCWRQRPRAPWGSAGQRRRTSLALLSLSSGIRPPSPVSPRLESGSPSPGFCRGLDLGASLQPSGPRIGQIAPPRGPGSGVLGVYLETRHV